MFTLLPGARTVPIYSYTCTSCNEVVERRQSYTDPPLTTCEQCGGTLRKIIHPVGIVFKGSGWYSTDSRASGSAASASSSSDSSGAKDGVPKDSGSKDSGSKDAGSSRDSGASKDTASKDSGAKDAGSKAAAAPSTASTAK